MKPRSIKFLSIVVLTVVLLLASTLIAQHTLTPAKAAISANQVSIIRNAQGQVVFNHKVIECGAPTTCVRIVNKTSKTVKFTYGYESIGADTLVTLKPGAVFKKAWAVPEQSTVLFDMGSQELIVKLEY